MKPQELKVDGQIELDHDIELPVTYLRWEESSRAEDGVPKGRYIINEVNEDTLKITAANWDENGYVTFRSVKHGYLIEGADRIRKFAEGLEGPRDWSPRKK